MPPLHPPPKGRGAKSNASGRYESLAREAYDDGWGAEAAEAPKQLQTTLTAERARKIITTNDSPDIGFNQSINSYRGCEHGCIYCSVTQCPRAPLGEEATIAVLSRIGSLPGFPAIGQGMRMRRGSESTTSERR
jgi:hypothetical protein